MILWDTELRRADDPHRRVRWPPALLPEPGAAASHIAAIAEPIRQIPAGHRKDQPSRADATDASHQLPDWLTAQAQSAAAGSSTASHSLITEKIPRGHQSRPEKAGTRSMATEQRP